MGNVVGLEPLVIVKFFSAQSNCWYFLKESRVPDWRYIMWFMAILLMIYRNRISEPRFFRTFTFTGSRIVFQRVYGKQIGTNIHTYKKPTLELYVKQEEKDFILAHQNSKQLKQVATAIVRGGFWIFKDQKCSACLQEYYYNLKIYCPWNFESCKRRFKKTNQNTPGFSRRHEQFVHRCIFTKLLW